ncbi:MAG: YciI family protein [Acidimicrobiales bacterium]
MKYFVMLAGDGEVGPWDQLTPEEQQAVLENFGAFDAACGEKSGVEMLGGEALEDGSTATTLRTRGGELTITDGPYAEATEQIGGFYLIDAPDLDTMTELCRSLPAYDIEIRPVVNMG